MFARQVRTSSTHEHIQELADKAMRFEVCKKNLSKHFELNNCKSEKVGMT